jgi:hypothetical protein
MSERTQDREQAVREGGAVDLGACRRKGGHTCNCTPACSVCGYGEHVVLHGPVYGEAPGSRPFHHEFVPGVGAPDRDNRWDYTEHPRQPWPASSDSENEHP